MRSTGRPVPARDRRGGFVLVAVLLVLLVVGVVAVAASLEAGLVTLGARSAAGAAVARSAARAALVLALDEVMASAGTDTLPTEFGPWDDAGVAAVARLAEVAGTEPPAYRLTATAAHGRSRAEGSAVIVLEPEPLVIEWRAP